MAMIRNILRRPREFRSNGMRRGITIAARHFAAEVCALKHIVARIKEQLLSIPNNLQGRPRAQAFIRANRNARYISRYRHFYTIGTLGAGAFGTVDLVVKRDNLFQPYALKSLFISKDSTTPIEHHFQSAVIEKQAMEAAESDFVVKILGAWIERGFSDKPHSFCLLTEFMPNGDLSGVIKQLYPSITSFIPRANSNFNLQQVFDNFFSFPGAAQLSQERRTANLRPIIANYECNSIKATSYDKYMRIIVTMMRQLIDAVSYLHVNHIVHRDIKPDNILVGFNMEAKLADYGLCTAFHYRHMKETVEWVNKTDDIIKSENENYMKILQQEILMNPLPAQQRGFRKVKQFPYNKTQRTGTFKYIPPELSASRQTYQQLMHRPKPTVYFLKHYPHDIYSLGCVFYKLCTGIHPISEAVERIGYANSDDMKVLHALMQLDPTRNFYLAETEEFNPLRLFINEELFFICRDMILPNYRNRPTIQQLDVRPSLASMHEQFCSNPSNGPTFDWNEFSTQQRPRRGPAMYNQFINRWAAGQGQMFEETERQPSAYYTLPAYSLFASAHADLNIVGTPVTPKGIAPENAIWG